jgi:hypothetical protein
MPQLRLDRYANEKYSIRPAQGDNACVAGNDGLTKQVKSAIHLQSTPGTEAVLQ